jgi:hypothetical protein
MDVVKYVFVFMMYRFFLTDAVINVAAYNFFEPKKDIMILPSVSVLSFQKPNMSIFCIDCLYRFLHCI